MAKVNGGRFFSAAAKPFLNTTPTTHCLLRSEADSFAAVAKRVEIVAKETFPVPPLAPNCKVILADEPKAT